MYPYASHDSVFPIRHFGIFDFCEDVEDRKQGMFDIQAVDEQTWRLGNEALNGS